MTRLRPTRRGLWTVAIVLACAGFVAAALWPSPGPAPPPAHAQAQPGRDARADLQAGIDASRRNAIVRAIESAAPAVVSINLVVEQRPLDPMMRDFLDLFFEPRPRPRVRRIDSAGSGFIYTPDGHIMTNYHVVEGGTDIHSVTLPDGRQLEAELVGADPRTDVAVLRARGFEPGSLPHLRFGDSGGLLIGEWAIAIGNPFGGLMNDPQPTVSVGVISANHRRVNPRVGDGERLYQDMIQTDAAINPGNSGGPLVNARGEVVGINTMIFSTSGGNVGLGFAIPIDRARRVAEEIQFHGRRRDPWPGFRVEDIATLSRSPRGQTFLRRNGIVAEHGAVVFSIRPDSPAYEAGLRQGDVITAVDGEPIHRSIDIDLAFWALFVGDDARLTVQRGDDTFRITVPVVELPM